MLVLTRKQQEKIQIGDNITITVLKMKGKTVRLGIEAPGSIQVLRGELAANQIGETEAAAPAKTPTPQPAQDWAPEQQAADDPKVVMQRVPRSRVASVLPTVLGDKMAGGRGPLRAMLDRRSAAAGQACH